MAISTKTKLIGTATTLTLTSVLVWIALNQGFILTASGDMTCSGTPIYSELYKSQISDCQIFWNITSTNYTYYFRNKGGNQLGFSPEAKGYEWFVKDGRYRSGYRPMDKSGNFTFRKGTKYQFMAFVFKEPEQTIKWEITSAKENIDPILYGLNVSWLCSNEEATTPTDIFKQVTYEFTCPSGKNVSVDTQNKYATCLNRKWISSNSSWSYGINFSHSYDKAYLTNRTIYWYESEFDYVDLVNETICNHAGIIVEDKIINFSKCGIDCSRDGSIVQCDLCNGDSNCDGILQLGESGISVDIAETDWKQKLKNWKVDSNRPIYVNGHNIPMKQYLRDCIG